MPQRETHADQWNYKKHRGGGPTNLRADLAEMRRAQQLEQTPSGSLEEHEATQASVARTVLGRMVVSPEISRKLKSLAAIPIPKKHTTEQSAQLVLPYVASEQVAPDIDLPTVGEVIRYSRHATINPGRPLAILEHMMDSDSGYDPDQDDPDDTEVTAVISGLSEQRERGYSLVGLELESTSLSRERRLALQIADQAEPLTEGLIVPIMSITTRPDGFRQFWDNAQSVRESLVGREVVLGKISCFPEVAYAPVPA